LTLPSSSLDGEGEPLAPEIIINKKNDTKYIIVTEIQELVNKIRTLNARCDSVLSTR
jgi:uncharacterized protein YlzI (FlbEa/FlbD family)